MRYRCWVSTRRYATHNIRRALPQVERLEARQRRHDPRQRLAAFRTQSIVPAPWHGVIRHEAMRSHLGALGPQSLGRVLAALRLPLFAGRSLGWVSPPACPSWVSQRRSLPMTVRRLVQRRSRKAGTV